MGGIRVNEGGVMDYLFTTIVEPLTRETPLGRIRQLKRESIERGYVPSNAEYEARENAARKSALETPLGLDNKGAILMMKMGYIPGKPLGQTEGARLEPIVIELKEGKGGIGTTMEERKRPAKNTLQKELQKKQKSIEDEARQMLRLNREEARAEESWWAAMKILERLEEAEDAAILDIERELRNECDGAATATAMDDHDGKEKKPWHMITLEWRPLAKDRWKTEREGKMHSAQRTFMASDMTAEDALAYRIAVEDLDEELEDPDLERCLALPAAMRLDMVVRHLRVKYLYCFWCKSRYLDRDMKGCPGPTEDKHHCG